jgi:hypothetical protein
LDDVLRRGFGNLAPKCPNEHAIGLGDKFYPTCGAALGVPQLSSRA